jgi:hypothetical protein
MADARTPQSGALRSITSSILDPQRPTQSLRREVVGMTKILADAGTFRSARQADISEGETRTSNGLALSPSMAAMCADDFVRTIEFIRGTQAAIMDMRAQYPDRPARILYAGCGPYAALAIPLMTIFSPQEAVFTLLDIHPEAIESVKNIAETLGLADSIVHSETMDAGFYHIDPDQPPDIILLEIMQACLAAEPQVAITRHLLMQAPDAILIPEEVRIDFVLADPSHEFGLDGLAQNADDLQRDRIAVTPVFVVNRETVNSWKSIHGNRLPGGAARLPDPMEQRYQPMLFTNIRVYQNHVLKDYDSGLTCPRLFTSNAAIQAGDTIQFHYELGRQPQLKGEVCAHPDQSGITNRSTRRTGRAGL